MKFNEKIKSARLIKRMTQEDLAKAIGVTTRTLQYYEAGTKLPRKSDTYDKLAIALCMDKSTLSDDNYSIEILVSNSNGNIADEYVKTLTSLWINGVVPSEEMDQQIRYL